MVQEQLIDLTSREATKSRKFKRAMLLLKADEGMSDPQVMAALHISRPTVERIRKRYVLGGLERALVEDPRPGQRRKLGGRSEAILVAKVCSQVPENPDHWTVRLLAGKLVELGVVESISHETIRSVLKKTNSSLG